MERGNEDKKQRVISPEESRKRSRALSGIRKGPLSDEHKEKISAATKGRVNSPETRKKISEGKKGQKLSRETRRNMARSQRERYEKMAAEGRPHANARPVRKIAPDGTEQGFWVSLAAAGRDRENPSASMIRTLIREHKPDAQGFFYEHPDRE